MRFGRWGLLVVAMTFGCVNDNVSVYVQNAIVPEAAGDSCEVAPDGAILLRGMADLTFGSSYGVPVVLRNSLFRRPGPVSGDPNGVFITDVIVTIEDLAGTPFAFGGPNPFTTQISTFIPSGDETMPGTAIAYLPLLPASYLTSLAMALEQRTMVFSVEFRGHTQGGRQIEVGSWQWVADLCYGCLLACDNPLFVLAPGNYATTCPVENILQLLECM